VQEWKGGDTRISETIKFEPTMPEEKLRQSAGTLATPELKLLKLETQDQQNTNNTIASMSNVIYQTQVHVPRLHNIHIDYVESHMLAAIIACS
jgi:hypothetical protein